MRLITRTRVFNQIFERELGSNFKRYSWLYDACHVIFSAGFKLGWAAAKKRYQK